MLSFLKIFLSKIQLVGKHILCLVSILAYNKTDYKNDITKTNTRQQKDFLLVFIVSLFAFIYVIS